MDCPKCGTPQPENVRFCTKCGTRIEALVEASESSAPETGTQTSELGAQAPEPEAQAPEPETQTEAEVPAPEASTNDIPVLSFGDTQAPAVPQYGQPAPQQPPNVQPQYGQQNGQPAPPQPPNIQPQYGQATAPQTPYGQPQYGQQSGQQYVPGQQPYATYQTQTGQPGYPEQPKKRKGVLIGVVVGIVLIVGIVLAVFFAVLPSCSSTKTVVENPVVVDPAPDPAPNLDPDPAPTPVTKPDPDEDRYYADTIGISFVPAETWLLDDDGEDTIFLTQAFDVSFVAISVLEDTKISEITSDEEGFLSTFVESFEADEFKLVARETIKINGVTWQRYEIKLITGEDTSRVIFYLTSVPKGILFYTYFEMPEYYDSFLGEYAEEEALEMLETLVIEE